MSSDLGRVRSLASDLTQRSCRGRAKVSQRPRKDIHIRRRLAGNCVFFWNSATRRRLRTSPFSTCNGKIITRRFSAKNRKMIAQLNQYQEFCKRCIPLYQFSARVDDLGRGFCSEVGRMVGFNFLSSPERKASQLCRRAMRPQAGSASIQHRRTPPTIRLCCLVFEC